jgi:hypothetical protein
VVIDRLALDAYTDWSIKSGRFVALAMVF